MVCNATPVSPAADDPLPMPVDRLARLALVDDVIHGHGLAPFLKAAQEPACKAADSDEMVEFVQESRLDFTQCLQRRRATPGARG